MKSFDIEKLNKLCVRDLKRLRKVARNTRKNPHQSSKLQYLNGMIKGKQEAGYQAQKKVFEKLFDAHLAELSKTKTMQHLKHVLEQQRLFVPRGNY